MNFIQILQKVESSVVNFFEFIGHEFITITESAWPKVKQDSIANLVALGQEITATTNQSNLSFEQKFIQVMGELELAAIKEAIIFGKDELAAAVAILSANGGLTGNGGNMPAGNSSGT
jgi:hypothetical protein